jgi:hypothetical protein
VSFLGAVIPVVATMAVDLMVVDLMVGHMVDTMGEHPVISVARTGRHHNNNLHHREVMATSRSNGAHRDVRAVRCIDI